MLARCKSAGRCLILQSIAEQTATQLTLRESGGFDGLAECIDALLLAKRNANRTNRYVNSLGYYLRQFAKGSEQMAISDFTFSHVEDWIARYPAAVTRQTWLNRLSTLFSFCVRRGLIAANPCDRIERVTVDRKPPLILTPGQSRALLAATPTVMKPYVVLGMFAGIRPEEITRLDWSQINLDAGTVTVEGKTRRRRLVTLEPVALAALRQHPLQRGAVAPCNSTVDRWRLKARRVLGLDRWPQDLLRHTAASYLLALHQNAAKVALRLGNSEKILMAHYYAPVNGDCGHFWECDAARVTQPGPVTVATSQ